MLRDSQLEELLRILSCFLVGSVVDQFHCVIQQQRLCIFAAVYIWLAYPQDQDELEGAEGFFDAAILLLGITVLEGLHDASAKFVAEELVQRLLALLRFALLELLEDVKRFLVWYEEPYCTVDPVI